MINSQKYLMTVVLGIRMFKVTGLLILMVLKYRYGLVSCIPDQQIIGKDVKFSNRSFGWCQEPIFEHVKIANYLIVSVACQKT